MQHGNMNIKYLAVILPKRTVAVTEYGTNLCLMPQLECATFKVSNDPPLSPPPQIHWTTSTKLYLYVKNLTPCTRHCDKL
jgi:hypothetical protein